MKKLLVVLVMFLLVSCDYDINNMEVVRVYDGDTFFINVKGWNDLVGKDLGIRIKGIDAPELNTKDPEEKQIAIKCKNRVEYLLNNAKNILLTNYERGKYFRIASEVYVDNTNISTLLIEERLAKPYNK